MRKLLILIVFMSEQTFATPPECPLFKNKKECLAAVDKDNQRLLDFIGNEENPDAEDELLQAFLDIKKYESLACHKTCAD